MTETPEEARKRREQDIAKYFERMSFRGPDAAELKKIARKVLFACGPDLMELEAAHQAERITKLEAENKHLREAGGANVVSCELFDAMLHEQKQYATTLEAELEVEKQNLRNAVEVWQRETGSAYAREDQMKQRIAELEAECERLNQVISHNVRRLKLEAGKVRWPEVIDEAIRWKEQLAAERELADKLADAIDRTLGMATCEWPASLVQGLSEALHQHRQRRLTE